MCRKRQFETLVVAGVLGLAAVTFAVPAGAQSIGANGGGLSIGGSNAGNQTSASGGGAVGGSSGNFNIGRNGNRSTSTVNLGSLGGSTGSGTLSLGGGQGALSGLTVGSVGQTGSIGTGGLLGGGTPGGVADAFGELTPAEQRLLQRKCTSVMASPGKFGGEIVALCAALASL